MTAVDETTIERAELKAFSKANESLRTAQNLPAGLIEPVQPLNR